MTLHREQVQRWLDAYSRAWETYDRDQIVALFTDGAEYRWHPWDEGDDVAVGTDQIAAAWVSDEAVDPPGTYEGRYEPVAVDGDVAVARGVSRYWTDAGRGTLDHAYHNLFVMRFADDGRCRWFTEWYMEGPEAASAAGTGPAGAEP